MTAGGREAAANEPVAASCPLLEVELSRKLEGARAARTEDAASGRDGHSEAGRIAGIVGIGRKRVGEAGVVEIADAEDIGHVEDVESFTKQTDGVPVAETE